MSRRTGTITPAWFDALYAADGDPWGFRSSDYEREKYAATLAALTRPRYAQALEVGCSIGVFTGLLAPRCARLLAIDGSARALAAARAANDALPHVAFEQRTVPDAFPPGRFDLIVLSEVLYYLAPADLDRVATQCGEALSGGGEMLLCHWLGETDYPLSGAEASDRFVAAAVSWGCGHARLHDRTYRLDRLRRPSPAAGAG